MKKFIRGIYLFFLLGYMFGIGYYTQQNRYTLDVIEDKLEQVINPDYNINSVNIDNPMSERDSIVYYLFKHNVEHPDIVLRQFTLESGHFTSSLFNDYNNGTGMKVATLRYTSSNGKTLNGYAKYTTIEDCVIDYKSWQRDNCSGLTVNEYYKYLNRVYAEDKYYVVKLKRIKVL